MQLHSVTKSLSRALVLLALVAFSASAFAQQRYVITNGAAYKRAKAMVGNKFLALDYTNAKNPTITVKGSFDESCVWYCNGKPGYYYQLDAEGDRFYLMRTGQTLHVMPVLMGTQNEVFESATQWYDWTFGVATQELAGDARYYWVILNADGNSWGLSGDTYGRPGDVVNANFQQPTTTGNHPEASTNGLPSSLGEFIAVYGDNDANGCKVVTEYHSSTASDARYYAGTTTPMVAATYTPLLVEQVAGNTSGGMTAVSPAATTMVNGNADVTVSLTTSQFTSTSYTKYTLQQIEPSDDDPNYSCNYMTPWLTSTTTTAYVRYQYNGIMDENEPADGRAAANVDVVGYAWTLDNNLARYLDIVDVEGSTTSKILRVKSGASWSSPVSGKLTIVATYKNGEKQTLQVDVTLNVDPTAVAADNVHIAQAGQAPLSYTLTPADAVSTINVTGVEGLTYNNESNIIIAAATLTPGDKTATITASKADNTTVNGTFHVFVHPAAPTVSGATAGNDGMVTLTRANIAPSEGSIYYSKSPIAATTEATLTGLTEFTSSTSLKVNPGETIYLVSYVNNYRSIEATAYSCTVNSGTTADGTTIIINDLEDHNWSYYQPADSLPAGYPSQLRSPDPRNVKITYRGGGVTNGSAVAISYLSNEQENTMVYYKTIEKTQIGMTGNYPYQVISNPFSKRPATGSGNNKQYYGFGGWKVISGGEYISEYNDNATLPLDATIHFTGLDANYAPNCMSAEIVLEATWTVATVKQNSTSFTGGDYEHNFCVLTSDQTNNLTIPANVTVMGVYPDGTGTKRTVSARITASGNNSKIENVTISGNDRVDAAGYTFTVGRGVTGNHGSLYGSRDNKDQTNTVKVESGTYSDLYHFGTDVYSGNRTPTSRPASQKMILGCDYDRAKGDNAKLVITGDMWVANGDFVYSSSEYYVLSTIKSGSFQVNNNDYNNGSGGDYSYYVGCGNINQTYSRLTTKRFLLVEGGHLKGIAGGMDATSSNANTGFELRVRGTAQIDGVVYGAATFAKAGGIRKMVFTGGEVDGWIAGGCNGTQTGSGGELYNDTYIYVGGTTKVGGTDARNIGNVNGGNIFGAGKGLNSTDAIGQVENSNVAIADQAVVKENVYGGGNYGYLNTNKTAKVYVLGGTVKGSVFGGSNQRKGEYTVVNMTGGEVQQSVYGGSNTSGTINQTSTVTISGGNVKRNVFGGGLGANTAVTGAVSVTVNGDAHIEGCVYGGGQDGKVNNTTTVKIESGTIDENVYGGGLGTAATVSGTTNVIIGK